MSLHPFLENFFFRWRATDKKSPRPPETPAVSDPAFESQDLEDFDWKFYVRFYPDLRRSGIKNRKQAVRHWLQHGRAEGRIGGKQHRTFRDNFQILKDYLATSETRAAQLKTARADPPEPLVNILTRTNLRPRFFHDNRRSVVGQTYRRFRQLASYENKKTLKYLQKENFPAGDLIPVFRKPTRASHPYNLFINDLMDHVHEGWILFLDDDDLFTTPHALAVITAHMTDEDCLIIWRTWFPDKNIPQFTDIARIQPGGITSCCFAFHSKHKEKARWHEFKAGDYRCFDQLRKFLKPVFLDDVLTKVNYTNCSAGWGEASDKKK